MAAHGAKYWEGFDAAMTHKVCRFTESADMQEWADGFAQAVAENQSGKVWWKSNTIRVAIICLFASIVVLVIGHYQPGQTGNVMMGAGGGMTLQSILSIGLRQALNSPISWNSGGSSPWSNYGN